MIRKKINKNLFLLLIFFHINLYATLLEEAHRAYMQGKSTKAITLLKQSCSKGTAIACSNLAIIYYKNDTIKYNKVLSQKYNKQACSLDDAQGCANLARSYIEMYGYKKTILLKAIPLLKKACKLNYKSACEDVKILQEDYLHEKPR